jgi:hypothetical protein
MENLDLLMKSFDRFGSSASILFQFVDASQLSLDQFHRLEQESRLIWSFLGDFHVKSVFSIASECHHQSEHICELLCENLRLRKEIKILSNDLLSSQDLFARRVSNERQSLKLK